MKTKVKATVTLDEDLWNRLRMHALRQKTSASAIMEQLIVDYLKTVKKGGV